VSTAKSWDSSYEWKAVLTLSLAFGLVGLDRFILPPLFPAMMKDLALNYQDLGNLVGALGIAWGVSAVVIGEEILKLKHRIHVTSLVVSHDRDLAFGVADRIAVINEGRILAIDSPDQIKNKPDPLIQKFLNADFSKP